MYTGDVWGITLIALGFIAAAAAFQILVTTVFARRVEAARRQVDASPWASLGSGLLVLGFGFVAVVVASKAGAAGPPLGVVGGLLLSILGLLGWTTTSRAIGERMTSSASAPWRATLRGAVTTGLVAVTPFLGWFLVLPLCMAMGTGALLLSAVRRVEVAAAPSAAVS